MYSRPVSPDVSTNIIDSRKDYCLPKPLRLLCHDRQNLGKQWILVATSRRAKDGTKLLHVVAFPEPLGPYCFERSAYYELSMSLIVRLIILLLFLPYGVQSILLQVTRIVPIRSRPPMPPTDLPTSTDGYGRFGLAVSNHIDDVPTANEYSSVGLPSFVVGRLSRVTCHTSSNQSC